MDGQKKEVETIAEVQERNGLNWNDKGIRVKISDLEYIQVVKTGIIMDWISE